jgi:hypothetical protein
LAWSELNRALRQIVRYQAGLRGGQHDQYCRYGENSGKITVGKKSLREIQHPGSCSIRFHRFHSIWSKSLLTFMNRQGKPASLTLHLACDSLNESTDEPLLLCFGALKPAREYARPTRNTNHSTIRSQIHRK